MRTKFCKELRFERKRKKSQIVLGAKSIKFGTSYD